MRFVNVAVSDVAPLLGLHAFRSRKAAVEKIRRRGGIPWRQGNSSSCGKSDEFATLRRLCTSRNFVEDLKKWPSRFADGCNGQQLLGSVEDNILADALSVNLSASQRLISSFVNTELGKAMEPEVMRMFEIEGGYRCSDLQRRYDRTWTHPKDRSIRVRLVGFVDAVFRDAKGRTGILEIKYRRQGLTAVLRHEIIQLKVYLTLAKKDRGILLQGFGDKICKKVVKRNDDWFYRRVKPAINTVALQIARSTVKYGNNKKKKGKKNNKKGKRKDSPKSSIAPGKCRSKGKG